MIFCKLIIAWCLSISVNFAYAQTQESCNRHVPRSTHNDHALLQLTKLESTQIVTFESTSTVVVRLKTFRQDPSNVASVIQCGIQAILSATMHFSVTPPRIEEGIFTLGDELLTCIENMLTPGQQALDGVISFRQAWKKSFEAIPGAAESITNDLEWYTRDGYAPALIRAIGTIVGTAGEVVTNFLPVGIAREVMKYLNAVVETFDTLGTSWDEFAKGNTVEGIEAIYWGLRSITDGVMPEALKNNTVYSTIIGTLDFVIGNLSQHVLEYERLILESNVCWRTEKMRGRVRPEICPSNQYVSDGAGYCYPLQSSLISVSTSSTLDSALQRKDGSQDGGYTPGHSAIPAQCDMDSEFSEKHGTHCYTPCNNGWQQKQDNVLKCISACEGKFPAESQGMCGRDSGIIAKAIMEMVTVVLNSAFTLAENIIKMQQHGVDAELLTDTIQVFIDMGKPFARPLCPEGEAPTAAPTPIACTRPCSPGFDAAPGQCRLLTGDLIICLPAQGDGLCAAGQVACAPTPAPTLALETTAPTLAPTGWVNGGRRRTLAPTSLPTTMLLPATPLPTGTTAATPAPTTAAIVTPAPTIATIATPAPTDATAAPPPTNSPSTPAPTDAISTLAPTDAPTDAATDAPTDTFATPVPTSATATPAPALTEASMCQNGILNGDVCCAASCGTCGGSGCGSRPGGTSQCCAGLITSACTSSSQIACKVQQATPFPTGTTAATAPPTTAAIATPAPTNAAIATPAPTDATAAPPPTNSPSTPAPTDAISTLAPTDAPTDAATDAPTDTFATPVPTSATATPAPAPTEASMCQNGILNGDVCCAASCGTCGGSGCGSRPGGTSQCCAGLITSACTSSSQVACKVQQATPFPTGTTAATAPPTTAAIATPAPTNAAIATPAPTDATAAPPQTNTTLTPAPTGATSQTPTDASATPVSTDTLSTPSPTDAPTDADAISTPVPTNAAATPTPAPTASLYIRAPDQMTSIHALGGTRAGNALTMHACPTSSDHPNCQWQIVASTTRTGMYYIKASDKDTYIHASGGTSAGNALTMHACPASNDHPNCQWQIVASTTRTGMYYIKASDKDTYIHASGGTSAGNALTMYACPASNDYPNCQWSLSVPEASLCQNGILNGDVCCAASCGTCGGSACARRPGGASQCCVSLITSPCTSTSQVACKVPQASLLSQARMSIEAHSSVDALKAHGKLAGPDHSDFDDYHFHDH